MLTQLKEIEPVTSGDPVRRMNILVLDDSEVDRKRLLRLCDQAGMIFSGTEVGTIDEMRCALATQKFDLVFIDYLLVGEDGLDAVKLLIDEPAQSAVSIMVAGEGRLDIALEAMRRGCSDYIPKSDLSVDSLQKTVATAIERRMVAQSLEKERERREKLEASVRRYAQDCSVEMRTILAGTLRRVRKLRSHKMPGEYAKQLSELESGIDQLWTALPDFNKASLESVAADPSPKHIAS